MCKRVALFISVCLMFISLSSDSLHIPPVANTLDNYYDIIPQAVETDFHVKIFHENELSDEDIGKIVRVLLEYEDVLVPPLPEKPMYHYTIESQNTKITYRVEIYNTYELSDSDFSKISNEIIQIIDS